ncbi:unnamed protein product [Caenorhabditis angaria]|uniref:Nose resistant-to-fluoxetine protein N-terminal domain-containing protein n=1 Tax=Caenorhabditis angaria TaxID=860376 RepID=A0A9P1I7D2_9PELO|nr:unnamed protein product [Caenorhabditis angaria]
MQFKSLLILQFLAGIFGSKKLDTNWAQLAIDKYFQSKNSSGSIQLPEFHLTEKDENCILASADILRQAYNFLTKCKIGEKDKDCLDPNWAVRLLDSIPLLKPAGFFRRGPFYFLADYATCRKLPHDKTQYCRIKGALENVTTMDLPFTIGLCLPKACEAETLGRIAPG